MQGGSSGKREVEGEGERGLLEGREKMDRV